MGNGLDVRFIFLISLKQFHFPLFYPHTDKENLLYDISVLDGEFEKRLDFINMLDKLKAILYKLLSMIPVVREFAMLVEEKGIYGLPPLMDIPLSADC